MHTSTMETIAYLKQTGKNFCKCGIAGWCLEVVFTSVESMMLHDWRLIGKTSLLMFPIYGMGALLAPIGKAVDWWVDGSVDDVRSRSVRWLGKGRSLKEAGNLNGQTTEAASLSRGDQLLRHGMLYMVLIFVAEYITGAWLRSRGIWPWDYTGRHSNVNGLIRLDFAPLWFGTGLLFEQITKKKGA